MAVFPALFITVCMYPMYYAIKCLNISYKFFETLLVLLRYPVLVHFGLLNSITFRVISILGIQSAVCRNMMIRPLSRKSPSSETVRPYKEMQITSKIVQGFEAQASAVLFGAGFLFMLMVIAVSNLSYRKNNFGFAIPLLSMAIVTFACLQIAFICGGSMHKFTHRIVQNWRNEVKMRNLLYAKSKDKHLLRIVKSLQAIEIPVGHLCIINTEVEMLYWNLFLNQLVNVLIALGSLV